MLINVNKYETGQIINALDISIEELENLKADNTQIFKFIKEETLEDLKRIRKKFDVLYD